MNTEQPVLRPFEGMDQLQAIAAGIMLIVEVAGDDPARLLNGATYRSEFADLRKLGLALKFDFQKVALDVALSQAKLGREEIKVLVVIDAPFLRNRQTIDLGEITNLDKTHVLCSKDDDRNPVFKDRRHGFNVEINFVLAVDKKIRPLSPYRKGSVLASVSFAIKPLKDGLGLTPRPLVEDERRRLRVPATTEIFIEVFDELLKIETFDGNVTIWMNEDLYEICRQKPKQSEYYLKAAANHTLIQIVYLVSAELKETLPDALHDIEQNPPMVINLLNREFKKLHANTMLRGTSFVSVLRSKPEKIAGVFSGIGGSVNIWKKILDPE